jgi:hypothetical protein
MLPPGAAEAAGLIGQAEVHRAVRDVLDAYRALGIDAHSLLPRDVADWYGEGGSEGGS